MKKIIITAAVLLASILVGFSDDWQSKLKSDIPVLGHRNWIVIADAAYPKQSAPGIETVFTGGDQLEVLKTVLKAIEDAPHVNAKILIDAELEGVQINVCKR